MPHYGPHCPNGSSIYRGAVCSFFVLESKNKSCSTLNPIFFSSFPTDFYSLIGTKINLPVCLALYETVQYKVIPAVAQLCHMAKTRQKLYLKKFVKLIDHTRASNKLTIFLYKEHSITGNRTAVNWLKKFVKQQFLWRILTIWIHCEPPEVVCTEDLL